jgi:hypothetical protein
LEVDLSDFDFDEGYDIEDLDSIGILGKMLASNRGIRKQPTMIRLIVAGGLEMIVGHMRAIDRKAGGKRSPIPSDG